MKNILIGTVCALALIAFAGQRAMSARAAQGQGAVHIDSFSCTMLDGDGNSVSASASRALENHGGQVVMNCTANVPNTTGRAAHFSGPGDGTCGSVEFGVTTEDWHETVSASGNATLTCHFSTK